MQLRITCSPADINFASLPELPARLSKLGFSVGRTQAKVSRFSETVVAESLDAIVQDVKQKGLPASFDVDLWGQDGESKGKDGHQGFWFNILRREYSGDVHVLLQSQTPDEPLKSLMEFFGLRRAEPKPPQPTKQYLPRTIFIAHRFDDAGQEAADKAARFLSLLGFDCQTGRGYAPGSVAEKVKARLEGQAVVVAIMTPGDDATWLTQESLLGSITGKPLIILKESKATFKPGLLSDHEYIPFTGKHVEQTFIPMLEGLIELKYNFKR